jgi:hypothetical protein
VEAMVAAGQEYVHDCVELRITLAKSASIMARSDSEEDKQATRPASAIDCSNAEDGLWGNYQHPGVASPWVDWTLEPSGASVAPEVTSSMSHSRPQGSAAASAAPEDIGPSPPDWGSAFASPPQGDNTTPTRAPPQGPGSAASSSSSWAIPGPPNTEPPPGPGPPPDSSTMPAPSPASSSAGASDDQDLHGQACCYPAGQNYAGCTGIAQICVKAQK